ncbi:MAG: exonuclease SbcCD subunit D [Syntrophobacterales bacterium]|nr:MAG: exonuclease SbcCD subunit D [Syntrophobacterales bacterium]
MKIVHLSDTHLGYSAYAKATPSGINQREQDIYDAFNQVIDRIIDIGPDLVLHAGDVFHTPRPSNRAITQALLGFQRLSSNEISTVVIAGNHSMPRIRSSSCILESINLFPEIYVAFKGEYEKFHIDGTLVHCVPHCGTEDEMIQAFDAVKPSGKAGVNILVTHAGLTADVDYVVGEFNELKVPSKMVIHHPHMDYIALGHYHRAIKVGEGAYYSGSTERFGFSDADHPCGFLEVDLPAGTVKYHEIEVREMVKLPEVDCHNLTSEEILGRTSQLSRQAGYGGVVQLPLIRLNRSTYVEIDQRTIREQFDHVYHLEIICQIDTPKGTAPLSTDIAVLHMEFEAFVNTWRVDTLEKKRLKEMGLKYLETFVPEEEQG